ncbi:MAG: CehA/McbA family metallohydrolase [Luteitalea sp.]
MLTRSYLPLALVISALMAVVAAPQPPPPAPGPGLRWFKGNTHTHTLNSDGDSTPDDVVRWYREHRYDFVVLTDHNFLTDTRALAALHGADERFLVIKGEEVSSRFEDKPLHINGLDVSRQVTAQAGTSVVDVLQKNVDAIRAADGVPHINHPNFGWAITADELAAVRNNRLFEIFNGHPMVNNLGGGDRPGLEQMWDAILTRGILLYGIAVDDAHDFKRPWDRSSSRPGQGWVVVRAPRLEARAILEAMERGDFYASTGVELADYRVAGDEVTVSVKETRFSKYRIQFVGRGGQVLYEGASGTASYRLRAEDGYVRARVIESNGLMAWTQPVMVARPGPAP